MPTDQPSERRRFRLPRVSGRQLLLGAGAALALGFGFGFLVRPDFSGSRSEATAQRPMAAVPIEINRPPAPPPAQAQGKLDVLPPDLAAAAQRPSGDAGGWWTNAAPHLSEPPPLPPERSVAVSPPPRVAQLDVPPASPASTVAPDCAGADGVAAQMVCSDPGLAAADREMSRAYRRALQAGVSPGALRADQRDWLGIREDAARHSRRALAEVYAQRIDELNAAADDGAQPDEY